MKTEEDYEFMLGALLPRGAAWRGEYAGFFSRLIRGFAPELARFEIRARELVLESNPATAKELRPEWSGVVLADPDSVGEDENITDELGVEGGNHAGALVDIAAGLGYRATIDTFPPFRIGHSGIDRPLYDGPWSSTFRMNVYVTNAADVIRAGGIPELEEIIRKKKPANSWVLFRYLEDV